MSVEDLHDAICKIALHDDQVSFEKVYKTYYRRLYGLALSIVKSQEAAEEIYDDVMLSIWCARAGLLNVKNFTVYAYVAVKNRSLKYLGTIKKVDQVCIDEVHIELQDFNPTAYDRMISAEFINQVNSAIQQLPPQCRLVFKLVKEDGLKYREVAEILQTSIKNVEYHIASALKKINRHINTTQKPFIKTSLLAISSN